MGAFDDVAHVDDFKSRIGNTFEKHQSGVGAQGRIPGRVIGPVDQGDLDTKPRQNILKHIQTRSKQCPRGYDVVPRFQQRRQSATYCRHT